MSEQPPPERPGPYGGVYGEQPSAFRPNPYSSVPSRMPRQVKIASAISLALGVLTILLGLFALTSAGKPITKTLTGDEDAQNVVLLAALLCSAAYILPAIFLRKQRRWARTTLIVVAALGIAGSITSLPGGLLGLALHLTLLILMLQTSTKNWFHR
jgi:O-antigen/teichoic acid export membrane protein